MEDTPTSQDDALDAREPLHFFKCTIIPKLHPGFEADGLRALHRAIVNAAKNVGLAATVWTTSVVSTETGEVEPAVTVVALPRAENFDMKEMQLIDLGMLMLKISRPRELWEIDALQVGSLASLRRQEAIDGDDLLRTTEFVHHEALAETLGVHKETVWALMSMKNAPAPYYRADDVAAFTEEQTARRDGGASGLGRG